MGPSFLIVLLCVLFVGCRTTSGRDHQVNEITEEVKFYDCELKARCIGNTEREITVTNTQGEYFLTKQLAIDDLNLQKSRLNCRLENVEPVCESKQQPVEMLRCETNRIFCEIFGNFNIRANDTGPTFGTYGKIWDDFETFDNEFKKLDYKYSFSIEILDQAEGILRWICRVRWNDEHRIKGPQNTNRLAKSIVEIQLLSSVEESKVLRCVNNRVVKGL